MTTFGDFASSANGNAGRFTEEYLKFKENLGRVTPEQILRAFGSEIRNLRRKRGEFSKIVTTIANGDESSYGKKNGRLDRKSGQ